MVTCSTCFLVVTITIVWHDDKLCKGLLYPQDSETREQTTLDGIWNFRLSPGDKGFPLPDWYTRDLSMTGPVIHMPVPASYNDITENAAIRDHIGLVWYDRRFYVPTRWKGKYRVCLRFGSIHFSAMVWVNTKKIGIMQHNFGHLPFEHDVTNLLNYDGDNLITVVCNNTFTVDTIPQGELSELFTYSSDSGNKFSHYQQSQSFRFFNYAGIHRSVFLYTTPFTYISQIKVNTEMINKIGATPASRLMHRNPFHCRSNYSPEMEMPHSATYVSEGTIEYTVSYEQYQSLNPEKKVDCRIQVLDRNRAAIVVKRGCSGKIFVENAHLWWPHLMSEDTGYLYTLQVFLSTASERKIDVYRLKIGIRTVKIKNTTILINDVPMYMRGINLHEDSDIRGRGFDLSLLVKNFNILRWIGANTILTAHYPHTEETYQLADELGIMIIDQCFSTNARKYTRSQLMKHKRAMSELIDRDQNHPSVIMWSMDHMPYTWGDFSALYLGEIANYVRSLDPTRPITMSLNPASSTDDAAHSVDVISMAVPSRYNNFDIVSQVVTLMSTGQRRHNKPVIVSEYGAETINDHLYQEYGWSVDNQVKMMSQYFRVFDLLKQKGFLIGEFFVNFADIKSAEPISESSVPKTYEKGILMRSRQPRASAHHLRKRYHLLAEVSNNRSIPDDLYCYVMNPDQEEVTTYINPSWFVLGMREYKDKLIEPKKKRAKYFLGFRISKK